MKAFDFGQGVYISMHDLSLCKAAPLLVKGGTIVSCRLSFHHLFGKSKLLIVDIVLNLLQSSRYLHSSLSECVVTKTTF